MTTVGKAWVITLAANGNLLTYDIFQSGGLDVDECHYTMDSAVVYVYVHFRARISKPILEGFLRRMREERHIMLFEIFGYESVACDRKDSRLIEHVGFKVLMKHYQTQNSLFQSCTDGAEGIVRGLLWRNDYAERLRQWLRSRNATLAVFYEDLEKKSALCSQHEESIELLREEMQAYEERIREYKARLSQYMFSCLVFRDRIAALDPSSQELMLEPDHLGRPIFPDE